MNIPVLGTLRPHSKIPKWLTSNEVAVPYFDGREMVFILDALEESSEAEAANAVIAFLKLGPKDRALAASYVFANYLRMAELIADGDSGCQIGSEADVWKHVHPSEIFISKRPRRDLAIYVQIMAECDWEPEHGLQIIYRYGSELSRVSAQDGHLTHTDAYDLPEDQQRIA